MGYAKIAAVSKQIKTKIYSEVWRSFAEVNWARPDIVIRPLKRPAGNGFQIDALSQSIAYAQAGTFFFVFHDGVIRSVISRGTVAVAVPYKFPAQVDFKFVIWRKAESRSRKHGPKIKMIVNLPIETADRKNDRIRIRINAGAEDYE